MTKLRVGLLFGGRSVEHEISVISATSILAALDPSRYEVTLVAVDHDGRWRLGDASQSLESAMQGEEVRLPATPENSALVSARAGSSEPGRRPTARGTPASRLHRTRRFVTSACSRSATPPISSCTITRRIPPTS